MALSESISGRKGEPSCHISGARDSVSFIQFQISPHTRMGFPMSQLCHYTLDANPAAEDARGAPPERLTFGFSTADVVLLGQQLGRLIEMVNAYELAAVMVLDERYANTLGKQPWVASIVITRIDKPIGHN